MIIEAYLHGIPKETCETIDKAEELVNEHRAKEFKDYGLKDTLSYTMVTKGK